MRGEREWALREKVLPRVVYVVAILMFVGNLAYIWQSDAMERAVMGNDEYFFYRVTLNLPHCETTGVWLCEEGAPNPEGVDDAAVYLFDTAYTTPIWIHPLAANVIAYPIAIAFNDAPTKIQWLRLFDIGIIIITAVLFLEIIRRKTNPYIAAVSILPLMVGRLLLANGIMFYHDLFMWLFFALTMWVITVRPQSRWIIILSLITVLCKQNAPLLLFPILIYLWYQTRDKRSVMVVGITSAIGVIGYMVFQAIVAGDWLYFAHHWGTLNPNAKLNITKNVLPYIWTYIISWGLWVSIPLLAAGIFLAIKRKVKSFYAFVAFGIVTLLYAFGWGSYAYQVFPIMYASMFMIPVIWFHKSIRGDVAVEQT